jgi:hypothetical protein
MTLDTYMPFRLEMVGGPKDGFLIWDDSRETKLRSFRVGDLLHVYIDDDPTPHPLQELGYAVRIQCRYDGAYPVEATP